MDSGLCYLLGALLSFAWCWICVGYLIYVDLFYSRDVDDALDPDVVARNERMIQFYIVLYGLFLASGHNLFLGDASFFAFLVCSVFYYVYITRVFSGNVLEMFTDIEAVRESESVRLNLRRSKEHVNIIALAIGIIFGLSMMSFFNPSMDESFVLFLLFYISKFFVFLALSSLIFISLSV